MQPAAGTGAESGAGFDSSGYGAFADEDTDPVEDDGRRRQILDAALKHVVRARQCWPKPSAFPQNLEKIESRVWDARQTLFCIPKTPHSTPIQIHCSLLCHAYMGKAEDLIASAGSCNHHGARTPLG